LEMAPVPEFNPERAPDSKSSPKKDSVSKSNPKRDFVPKSCPEREPEGSQIPALPPLLPPLLLSSGSPSAHPQPSICAVGSLWSCLSPFLSQLEDPL
ncbi:hypothetical protein M9458_001954, partial [Cirrhinus mrigala]